MATRQDPNIKNNPWLLEWDDEAARWIVPGASSNRRYVVDLNAAAVGDWAAACSCQAQTRCWHCDSAELRDLLDDCAEKCLRHYANWSQTELEAEDLRLRVIMSVEGAGPFLMTQYSACGDTLAAVIAAAA